MKDFYFTFGMCGENKGGYCKIKATCIYNARLKMVSLYGLVWDEGYKNKKDANVELFGLKLVSTHLVNDYEVSELESLVSNLYD